MKNIRVFLSENYQFLEMKFSVYLKRRVFVMFYQAFDAGKEIRAVFCNVSKALIEYGINHENMPI